MIRVLAFSVLICFVFLPSCFAENKCIDDLYRLRNGTYPEAVAMLNAEGRRLEDYGLYDQCRNTSHGHYCLLILKQEKFSEEVGLCLPESCTEQSFEDVLPILEQGLNFQLPNGTTAKLSCTPESRPEFTVTAWVIVSVCGLLGLLFIVGTMIDGYRMYVGPWLRRRDQGEDHLPEYTALVDKERKASESVKVAPITFDSGVGILRCWSGFVNFEKLLFPAIDKSLASLNGVRVMSIFAVILGHVSLFFLRGDNRMFMIQFGSDHWSFQLVLEAFFAVDTFFFMSGFLVAYLTLKELYKRKGKLNWGLFVFHRIWRLTPTLVLWLMLWWKVLPLMGLGPRWDQIMKGSVVSLCDKGWWKTLLYIQNFFKDTTPEEQCMGWTWYLGDDMLFYLITPFFIIPFYKSKPLGWAFLLLCIGGTVGLTMYQTVDQGYSYYFFSPQSYIGSSGYLRPWIRAAPYLAGIAFAFLLTQTGIKNRLGPFFSQCLLVVSLAVMFELYMSPYGLYHHSDPGEYGSWTKTENFFYIGISRLVWGMALSGMFYVCATGQGHVLNWFLSHEYWTPLARLTYSTYLIHYIVIVFYDAQLTQPLHWSVLTFSWQFISTTVLSYLLSVVSFVLIERPLQNLEKLMIPASNRAATPPKVPVEEETMSINADTKYSFQADSYVTGRTKIQS